MTEDALYLIFNCARLKRGFTRETHETCPKPNARQKLNEFSIYLYAFARVFKSSKNCSYTSTATVAEQTGREEMIGGVTTTIIDFTKVNTNTNLENNQYVQITNIDNH